MENWIDNSLANYQGKKILIVEDDEMCFYLLKEFLADTQIEIIHANNGQLALDIFNSEKDLDLVLLDIQIPLVDGYSVMQLIKSQNPNIPVIAQTAHGEFYNITKDSELTFNDYLPKPIDFNYLTELLEKYLMVTKTA